MAEELKNECNGGCEDCGENCNHDCDHCEHKGQIKKLELLEGSKIKKIVAVLSGKGGVGKSMVSGLLAVELAKKGYKVGIMDADITGPSIAKMFNLNEQLMGDEKGIFPLETKLGIEAVSINMMLESEDTPVLWRGPILGGVVNQFYSEVHWGELDYLVIDMPPGTSDVALTILQSIPVDEIVMVTSPSKLVSMVVSKAIKMAEATNTKVTGLVENMSYVKCDNCGHDIVIYNNDDTENIAAKFGLKVLGKLPIDKKLANLADDGEVDNYDGDYLKDLVEAL